MPDNVSEFRHRVERTGGTTGEPMQYLVDEDIWGYVTADKIVGMARNRLSVRRCVHGIRQCVAIPTESTVGATDIGRDTQ